MRNLIMGYLGIRFAIPRRAFMRVAIDEQYELRVYFQPLD
jgi:hypothetical protein